MAKGTIIVVILLATCLGHFCSAYTQTEADKECEKLSAYDRFPDAKPQTNCNKFWECDASKKAKDDGCFYGLAFDPTTKSCIWANYVKGCGGASVEKKCDDTNVGCVANTEDYNSMIEACVPKGTYVCDEGERIPKCGAANPDYDKKFIADKTDCAGYFYCDGETRFAGKCPSGYIFDPKKQQCSFPDPKKPCKPVLNASSSTGPEINWNTICKGHAGKFIRDPRTCWAYIRCSSETSARQDFCPKDKFFNNGICSATPPKTCGCEIRGAIVGTDVENAPHSDPNKYYTCKAGEQIETKCPSGKYDPVSQSCVIAN